VSFSLTCVVCIADMLAAPLMVTMCLSVLGYTMVWVCSARVCAKGGGAGNYAEQGLLWCD
jgi:hypothetical protein